MTTRKTIALTRQTFVGKVISLLFNMLSRLVITFLPRSKCLFISWLQSPSAVILEGPPPNKVRLCFHWFLLDSAFSFSFSQSFLNFHLSTFSLNCFYDRYYRLPWWLRHWSICLHYRRLGFNPWVVQILWRRKWQPTPVHLPGKSHGRSSLVGYSPWGQKESDMTERLHFTSW